MRFDLSSTLVANLLLLKRVSGKFYCYLCDTPTSNSDVFHHIQWLPNRTRVTYTITFFIHKCFCQLPRPSIMSNPFVSERQLLQWIFRQTRILRLSANLSTTVLVNGASGGWWQICGTLPEDRRRSPSLDVFKSDFKIYLFNV